MEKVRSYFLSTTEKDKARYIQKVKIANEDLVEVLLSSARLQQRKTTYRKI
jgi:translation initiation factor IF-1